MGKRDKYGRSADKKTIMAIGKPTAPGETEVAAKLGATFCKSVFKNECPHCHKPALAWGYKYTDLLGEGSDGSGEGHIYCVPRLGGCDADYGCITGHEHLYNNVYLTKISGPVKSSEAEALKLQGGEMQDDGESSDDSDTGSSGAKSAWDCLKEVAGKNNDDIMIYCFGDTVYVRRIPNKTYCHLSAKEDYNLIEDSVTVTEANPLMSNTIEVSYGANKTKRDKLTVSFPSLVKRYGEIKETLDVGNVSREEAKAYATTYLAKLLRNDGFQIECSVIGHPEFSPGRWCNFKYEKYNLEDTYFIKKISQSMSATEANKCELTLCTYSSDLTTDTKNEYGIIVEEQKSNDNESNDDTSTDDTTTDTI